MTPERHNDLQWGHSSFLTSEELASGWHFCPEMDDLLCIRGGDDCFCVPKDRGEDGVISEEVLDKLLGGHDEMVV